MNAHLKTILITAGLSLLIGIPIMLNLANKPATEEPQSTQSAPEKEPQHFTEWTPDQWTEWLFNNGYSEIHTRAEGYCSDLIGRFPEERFSQIIINFQPDGRLKTLMLSNTKVSTTDTYEKRRDNIYELIKIIYPLSPELAYEFDSMMNQAQLGFNAVVGASSIHSATPGYKISIHSANKLTFEAL